MTAEPYFSIVIPVHNGGDQFKRCLQAIQASEFTDWELVVVNDASDDGSDQLATSFGARIFHTPTQLGKCLQ